MRAIGIILAGGNNHRMRELSQKRAICAMPIAGSYRSIDFTLSNMTNSHIQKVAVFTQYNARSLNEHLNSSKWWDFGRKQGGLYVFTPAVTAENSNWYRGTADAIYQNLQFLKDSHEPYVVIASGDCVYKLDYNKVLEYHIEKKADITVVCRDMEAGTNVERFGTIRMNEESRIEEFEEKPLQAKTNTISCGIYVVRRRLLIEMIEKCAEEDRYDFVRDILIRYKDLKRIYGYKIKDYWRNIASVDDYYSTNMDFLKADVRNYFFKQYPDVYSKVDDLPPAKYNPGSQVRNSLVSSGCIVNGVVENSVIWRKNDYYSTNMDFLKADVRNYFFKQYPDVYSKVDDLPPAKYNPGSQVRNSLVSSGCIVNGVVENSVIFKKSYIGNNCVIKNSIILNDVYIGDNTHIENCIVESRDTIRANSYFVGEGEVKIVVERNERYVI